ncbi:MAG: tRNA glutamyl-Q(34) synthetase GluQRS [Planctomycetota bacterium]|nr:tRNA glutamyl-Q(34) synthetase GluQRS [Planctomycetota bacterium]
MQHVTRLAPSPTGALHLGNARTFLINWAMARRNGWRVVMRIEDLDGPRIKRNADLEALDVLRWLGLDWDGEPLYQSADLRPYEAAMDLLVAQGLAYPSDLSRSDIEAAASAPHTDSGEVVFPASLRPAERPASFDDSGQNWRFTTPDEEVVFDDAFAGPQRRRPSETIGDFVVWTKRAAPAYQLAVVVDDHRQGVTQIVRGDDLIDSAARQVLLYRALRLEPVPEYTHVPLVAGEDGRRLAKRHGDTRLSHYREQGVSAERIIGLLAGLSGMERRPQSAQAFAEGFDLATLPKGDVVFTKEDDAWLLDR